MMKATQIGIRIMLASIVVFGACRGASRLADIATMEPPAPETLPSVERNPFYSVTFNNCYDGDTCNITIPGLPEVFGKKLGLRIWGIDTPEIRGKCAKEKELAIKARDYVRKVLADAEDIAFSKIQRGKYFRVVARLRLDGRYLDETLIAEGLAVPYFGGTKTKDWCAP